MPINEDDGYNQFQQFERYNPSVLKVLRQLDPKVWGILSGGRHQRIALAFLHEDGAQTPGPVVDFTVLTHPRTVLEKLLADESFSMAIKAAALLDTL